MTSEEFDNYVRNEWGWNYSIHDIDENELNVGIEWPAMKEEAIEYIQATWPNCLGMYFLFAYHSLKSRYYGGDQGQYTKQLNALSKKRWLQYFINRPDMYFLGSNQVNHETPGYNLENWCLDQDGGQYLTISQLRSGGYLNWNVPGFQSDLFKTAYRYGFRKWVYAKNSEGYEDISYENTFKFYFTIVGFFNNNRGCCISNGLYNATAPHVSTYIRDISWGSSGLNFK